MKKMFACFAAVIGLGLYSLLSPAFADEARFAGRGWVKGVHSVAYIVDGDLRHVTAGELALAGVSKMMDRSALLAPTNRATFIDRLICQSGGATRRFAKQP